MAVTLPGTGLPVETDFISPDHHQLMKMEFGAAGTATPVSAANPLPVVFATAPTTPVTGTFWQATQPVSAASLPLPTGAATETTLAALNTKLNTEITADYDTGAGTQTMKLMGVALPASGGSGTAIPTSHR